MRNVTRWTAEQDGGCGDRVRSRPHFSRSAGLLALLWREGEVDYSLQAWTSHSPWNRFRREVVMSRRLAELYLRGYCAANARLARYFNGRFAAWTRPVSVSILLTERCNARCVHCGIWKNKGREGVPSLEQWKLFMDDLAAWMGAGVVIVFTGGEALLQTFAAELLEHAVRRGLNTELLTHGYWTDHSRLKRVACANPYRITMSLDGIGATHSLIRGRDNFWEYSNASLMALKQWRWENHLDYVIRLKTVVMEQNLNGVGEVARFAREHGFEVFYQPVERNYNTPWDPNWYRSSANWPRDLGRVRAAVEELLHLYDDGYPIANSRAHLQRISDYFADPERLLVRVEAHMAHESKASCGALTTLQVQPNGDVLACCWKPPVGNIMDAPIRQIWRNRPAWWRGGCCLEDRCSDREELREEEGDKDIARQTV